MSYDMQAVAHQVESVYLNSSLRQMPDSHGDRDVLTQRRGEELLLMQWSDTDVLLERSDQFLTLVSDAAEHLETGWSFASSATEEHWRSRRQAIDILFERICRECNVQYCRLPVGQVKPVWANVSMAEWDEVLESVRHKASRAFLAPVVGGGVSGSTCVLTRRLEQACVALAGGEARIVDIAEEFGFHSASHFTRTFTAHYGLSPAAWRAGRCNNC